MSVHVRFAGSMRELAGCQQIDVELVQGDNLRNLLVKLNRKLPAQFVTQIIQPILNAKSNITILMLNQKHIHYPDELKQLLDDGDVIVFVPPMEGG